MGIFYEAQPFKVLEAQLKKVIEAQL